MDCRVLQWLALLAHRKMVLGSNMLIGWVLSAQSLHVHPVPKKGLLWALWFSPKVQRHRCEQLFVLAIEVGWDWLQLPHNYPNE